MAICAGCAPNYFDLLERMIRTRFARGDARGALELAASGPSAAARTATRARTSVGNERRFICSFSGQN